MADPKKPQHHKVEHPVAGPVSGKRTGPDPATTDDPEPSDQEMIEESRPRGSGTNYADESSGHNRNEGRQPIFDKGESL